MRKLMRLELKKMRWRGFILAYLAAGTILALWCVGNVPNETADYESAFISIGYYVRMTMVVFSAVVAARMFIEEYRSKTIAVLFAYPIDRKRLFAAKYILIYGLTFGGVLVANAVILGLFLLADGRNHYFAESRPAGLVAEEAVRIVLFACVSASVSLIPIFFGMLRKSSAALIVASFVMSLFCNNLYASNEGNRGLITNLGIVLACLAAGVLAAALAARKADREDV